MQFVFPSPFFSPPGALSHCKDLLRSVVDDTAGHGQAGVALEVEINLTSCLAALVDTPD